MGPSEGDSEKVIFSAEMLEKTARDRLGRTWQEQENKGRGCG